MGEELGSGVLRGRMALVTGASRGIGRETAIRLAAEGARVVLVSRRSVALDELSALLGPSAVLVPADLAHRSQVERAVAEVVAGNGTPDILINNAGAFHLGPASVLDADLFEASLSVNVRAPFLFARGFLAGMIARGSGHVVSIGSIADRHIFPENSAYASSKYALRALHEVIRLETHGTGVRATLVSPGPVDTRLWDPIDPDNREGFTPREAMLDPQSVADAVMYAVTRPPHMNVDELRISRS